MIREDLLGTITGRFELCKYSIKYTDNNGNETFLDQEEIEFREKLKLGVIESQIYVEATSPLLEEEKNPDVMLEMAVEDMMDGD